MQYWRGVALSNLGRADEARKAWQEAAGRVRFRSRRRFWRPQSSLSAVHAMMALRRLGQADRADELASQLREAIQRLDRRDPRRGRAFAAMGPALLAAAEGRADEAVKSLEQARPDEKRLAGYVRLVGLWADLLKRFPAEAPKDTP